MKKRINPGPHPDQLTSRESTYLRSLYALGLMRRDGLSVTRAAKQAGTTPATVKRFVVSALTIGPEGIRAKPTDRLIRPMRFLDRQGLTAVTVNRSTTASQIADYMNAVEHYYLTGDRSQLTQFQGRAIRDSSGKGHPFITNTKMLDRFAAAGEARFESIYQFTSEDL